MRMPTLAALTVAASALLGTTAAFAGPLAAAPGVINTTETSYESLVSTPGDILRGIFFVSSIQGSNGVAYTYGQGGTFLTGVFDGFVLDTVTVSGPTVHLTFTGGSLKYYSSATNQFAGANLVTNTQLAPTLLNQANAISNIESGNLELALTPQLIDATHTLYIDILGGLNSFAAAATSTVYLDIVGGSDMDAFVKDSLINSFTAVLADAAYQGSANTQQCTLSPGWQVCGTNHATFEVIPEPITVSLFGAGLVGAAALRRRKAKKA